MEEDERLMLKKIYEDMSDEGLIDKLLEGKNSYQEGVYEVIFAEAKKRGLEERVAEAKKIEDEKIDEEIKQNRENNWVVVYEFFDDLVGYILGKMLKEYNIPSNVISLHDSVYVGLFNKSPHGKGVIEVREDYVEEAKKVVADFEIERQKKGEKEN